MANPFLVLGGIAISVATAAFGILQVPGWVASAQDAAATNDIAQVSAAQAAALSAGGSYATSMAVLGNLGGVEVTRSGGVRIHTATDPTAKHHLTVSRSASGAYFARTSESAKIGRANTIEGAVIAAGTTITGPATARVTAEGVPVPTARDLAEVVYENLFQNANIRTATGFKAFWGDGGGGSGTTSVVAANWTHSGNAIRFTKRSHSAHRSEHFDIQPPMWMEPGKRYTIVWEAVGPGTYTADGYVAGYPDPRAPLARVEPDSVVLGEKPKKLWATFEMGDTIGHDWQVFYRFDMPVDGWIEFGNVMMYEGDYDPDRPWFSGDIAGTSDVEVEWSGPPNASTAYAYR